MTKRNQNTEGNDTIEELSSDLGTTTGNSSNPHEGEVVETMLNKPVNTAPKDFKWGSANICLLLSRVLKVDAGKVTTGRPYDIWALKCVVESAHKFQQGYIVTKKGEIIEIPQGVSFSTYYDEIKAGACAVAYHGRTGDRLFTTVKVYGGATLPEFGTDQQQDGYEEENF